MIRTKSIWIDSEPVHRELERHAREFSQWLQDNNHLDSDGDKIPDQVLPSLMISESPPRDELKVLHPATFPEPDIEKLITFFTKKGDVVLDPFLGSGTTCIAAMNTSREGIGVELFEKWADLAEERINKRSFNRPMALFDDEPTDLKFPRVIRGDARSAHEQIPDDSVDFIVTSPPYWGILFKNQDHKAKSERVALDRPTDYGNNEDDLSMITDYEEFIVALCDVLGAYVPKLKSGKYVAIVVSDFRHKSKFHSFHSDLSQALEPKGIALEGITILAQTNKNLYPYGLPAAFVSNIHHQYVLIFRKPRIK